MSRVAETFALALQCHQLGKLELAEELYRQLLQIDPGHADSHHLLGVLAGQKGRSEEAVAAIHRALALNPEAAIYHANLGALYEGWGRVPEAVASYQQALRIRPDDPGAHCKLAQALARQAKLDDAVAHYREAIRLNPDELLAHNNLGEVLLKQGRVEKAQASFQAALRLQPDQPVIQSNLLFCLNHDPRIDPDTVFAEHCRWGKLHELAVGELPHGNDPDPERRLRIGYVSPDLRYHAVTRYLEPVLVHHDPQSVQVFCYAQAAKPDAVTARLQGVVHSWCWTCELTDDQLAQRIRDDQIDILVDLAGHTGNNRLPVFARKPAPVQTTWLGYLNTTGLTRMDYRLTDDVLDPVSEVRKMSEVRCPMSDVGGVVADFGHRTSDFGHCFDTEELFRLPGGMCCFAPPTDAPPVTPLPALRRGHLTFGSLHSLFKLNAGVFDLWSALLRALPSAHLLMFRDTLTGTARDDVQQEFRQRGIGPERLDLRLGSHGAGYLRVYGEIDVILDTFPCTGGVTTCESLWMGVPVLSLLGVRPAGRNSAALLSRVGLGDWAVETPQAYLARGVGVASDLDSLAHLRAELRDRMAASLCDGQRFTRVLEDAYRTMWRRWCAKKKSHGRNTDKTRIKKTT
jgi:protein O-GlcNAc transferase